MSQYFLNKLYNNCDNTTFDIPLMSKIKPIIICLC